MMLDSNNIDLVNKDEVTADDEFLISQENHEKILSPLKFILKLKKCTSKTFKLTSEKVSDLEESLLKLENIKLNSEGFHKDKDVECTKKKNVETDNLVNIEIQTLSSTESFSNDFSKLNLYSKNVIKPKFKKFRLKKYSNAIKFTKIKSGKKLSKNKKLKGFAKHASKKAWKGIRRGFKFLWTGLQSISGPLMTFDLTPNMCEVIKDIKSGSSYNKQMMFNDNEKNFSSGHLKYKDNYYRDELGNYYKDYSKKKLIESSW